MIDGVSGGRTLAFFRSVAARYAGWRPLRVAPVGLVLLQRARSFTRSVQHAGKQVRISPHIHLRLAVSTAPARRPAARTAVFETPHRLARPRTVGFPPGADGVRPAWIRHERPRADRQVLAVGHRTPSRIATRIGHKRFSVGLVGVERFLRRMTSRSERVDLVSTTGFASSSRALRSDSNGRPPNGAARPPVATALPVPRVVRSPVATADPQRESRTTRPHAEVAIDSPRVTQRTRDLGTEVDVESITDKVVNAIDRRMIAFQERMGRS